jgi:hypothetical protein
MKIKELRIGSLIEVNPRENQIGLLSIVEIQRETIIGEMISPKPGYLFRIKFDEINLIPLSQNWLLKFGFRKEADKDVWIDNKGLIQFYFNENGQKKFAFKESLVGDKNINTVHEFQNGFQFLTGEELVITDK